MYYLVAAIGSIEQLICVPQLNICEEISDTTPSQQLRQQERFISMGTNCLSIELVPTEGLSVPLAPLYLIVYYF